VSEFIICITNNEFAIPSSGCLASSEVLNDEIERSDGQEACDGEDHHESKREDANNSTTDVAVHAEHENEGHESETSRRT